MRRDGRFLSMLIMVAGALPALAADPLPSWEEGERKKALVAFVEKVTKEGSADFVPAAERIATFDNDGTLWCEHPMYTQMVFTIDRVKALAPSHPEWKQQPAFKAILEDDFKAFAATGEKGLIEVGMAAHAGMTTVEFETIVNDWIQTAKHPRFKRPYTECVYQPMLEVLAYLRANGFKTYIVSGGGVEFMRPWTEKVYGVLPEQVVGSTIKTKFELKDGKPVLLRLPEVDFIDDKAGKPIAINKFIGKRPLMAFGNSDGDFEMLEWATMKNGPGFAMIVHHTDGEREYAYDRDTHFGKLDKALTEAPTRGWSVIDMKNDWLTVFPPAK